MDYYYQLTTAHGHVMKFYIEGCAEIFRLVHGGTVEQKILSSFLE